MGSKTSGLMSQLVKVDFAAMFPASVRVLVKGGRINTQFVELLWGCTNTLLLFWVTGRMTLFLHLTCISWPGLYKIWDIVSLVSCFSKAHREPLGGTLDKLQPKEQQKLGSRRKAILEKQTKLDQTQMHANGARMYNKRTRFASWANAAINKLNYWEQ